MKLTVESLIKTLESVDDKSKKIDFFLYNKFAKCSY